MSQGKTERREVRPRAPAAPGLSLFSAIGILRILLPTAIGTCPFCRNDAQLLLSSSAPPLNTAPEALYPSVLCPDDCPLGFPYLELPGGGFFQMRRSAVLTLGRDIYNVTEYGY